MKRLPLILSVLFVIVFIGDLLPSLSSADTGEAAQPPLPLPRVGTAIQADAGTTHTCGIKIDGTIACWGDDNSGQSSAPNELFTSVSAGGYYSCGIKTNETVACWGLTGLGRVGPPSGTFTSVSAGVFHACGVKTDGTVACWENNTFGEGSPPNGTFNSVSAGEFHTCGIKTDDTAACWGNNASGESTPPSGTFTSISAGYLHNCGLKSDATLTCWGDNTDGQSSPPSGTFTSVSAGSQHTCALKTDGTITCWGNNDSGQSSSPSGMFTSVSAGGQHTCGIKTDGTLVCWGANNLGQINIPIPDVALEVASPVLVENGGLPVLSVYLSTLGFQNVSVTLAFSGTAVLGTENDYIFTGTNPIPIAVDSTSGHLQLFAFGDGLPEEDETIIIEIASVINAVEAVAQQVALTIPANDASTSTPTPTDTPNPPTATPTATSTPPIVSLLQNGGFEALDITPWTVKNATGDKIKCKVEKAYSGNCAYAFKGSEGENTSLQQTITPSGINFVLDDAFDLSLFVNGKSNAIGKIKLKVSYSDGTLADKFSQDMPTNGIYTEVSRRLALNSPNVEKIKLQIKHQSATGKVYVDDVSLIHDVGNGRLPLP